MLRILRQHQGLRMQNKGRRASGIQNAKQRKKKWKIGVMFKISKFV